MTGRAPLRPAAAGTLIAILAMLVLAADQVAKLFAIRSLPVEEPVHVIGDFLIFYLVRNPGAAFSLGEDVTWVFTIALALVAAVVVWLAATRVRSRLWAVVLGLLLGGVLGNLGDRLFRPPGFGVGHVVDFILTPWMWPGMNPAIYNLADVFIVSTMISVALLIFFGVQFDGRRERRRAGAPDSGSDSADSAGEPADAAVADPDAPESGDAAASADPAAGPADPAKG